MKAARHTFLRQGMMASSNHVGSGFGAKWPGANECPPCNILRKLGNKEYFSMIEENVNML